MTYYHYPEQASSQRPRKRTRHSQHQSTPPDENGDQQLQQSKYQVCRTGTWTLQPQQNPKNFYIQQKRESLLTFKCP